MKLFLRTLPYLRPYRRLLGLSSVILVLDSLVDLANPWVFKVLIDHVIGGVPTPPELAAILGPIAEDQRLFLVVIVTAGLVVAIVNNGLTVWNSFLQTKIEQGMILRFRSRLFEHAQRLSLTFHDKQRTGDFMYRINYSSASVGEIPMMVPQLAQSLLTLVGMFVITYLIDPTLALLSMTVAPLLWFSIRRYSRHVQPRLMHVRRMEGHSLTMIQEAMSMLRVIISFGRESHEHRRFTEQGGEAVDARVRLTVSQTMFTMAINVITAGGTALVLGYGAYQVIQGQLTLGTLLIVMAYVASVYNPLQTLAGAAGTIQEHLINLRVAFELLDTEAEIRDAPDAQRLEATQGRVAFRNVSFSYPGRVDTLKDVSFEVEPGQVVAIVGPTGAGKTTLMSLLPRFYDPQEGQVLLDGIEVRTLTLESLREHFSVVLQEPLLFSASIAENIRYGRLDASTEKVIEAARAANAHDFIAALPEGYDTVLGERGGRLSGGERQRIAVARAFLKDAPILILDEPTSSVDSRTESVILDALDRLIVGRTTFMIAHRLSTVRHADLIVVLDHGRIVEQGDHEALMQQNGLYHQMHEAQTQPVRLNEARRSGARMEATSPALPSREKVVVLGMMTKMPVAGVVWQTVHYLVGLERMGYEVYYVEAHARTPSMFMETAEDDGAGRAAAFIRGIMDRFGLKDRWAYQALHADGATYGMSPERLASLYREAALVINLHGGTQPREEHAATGRLVYLETDPVTLQVELAHAVQSSIDFLAPHVAFFTFGENLGNPDCGLPISDRFPFLATRQPVVLDMWDGRAFSPGEAFTTVANWRQQWREVTYRDQTYHWSKHLEFLKVIDLPSRTSEQFELALSGCDDDARALLERHGWRVRDALALSMDLDDYRGYICGSRAEFTVAKDQNVRLRSGWFSDRSATYLAAGRPVVTQDTGFGNIIPTGQGLFAFGTLDEAVDAVERIAAGPGRQGAAAAELARDYFSHEKVLGQLLESVGLRGTSPRSSIPGRLSLTPVSRRPLRLPPETLRLADALTVPARVPDRDGVVPAVSMIIVTYENLALTKLCLASILENTDHQNIEVIVVDNGSSDGTPQYLQDLARRDARVKPLSNETNRGFPAATNQGIRAAAGDRIVLLNNDTLVPPGWLAPLLRHLDDASVGAVGPVTNRIGTEAQIDTTYDTHEEFLEFAGSWMRDHEGEAFDVPTLAMYCLAMRRDVYARIGPLDETFGIGLLEDDDYAARLRAAALRSVCARDVFVHHFGEGTFGDLVPGGEYGEILQTNKRRFREKWGKEWQPYGRRPSHAYDALVAQVVGAVRRYVPAEEPALVISRGDERFIDVQGNRLWHFPGDADGVWAGYYPADSGAAVRLVEDARGKGAGYLVIPVTSAWWLEHYDGLREHLDTTAELIHDDPASCRIFRLRDRPGVGSGWRDVSLAMTEVHVDLNRTWWDDSFLMRFKKADAEAIFRTVTLSRAPDGMIPGDATGNPLSEASYWELFVRGYCRYREFGTVLPSEPYVQYLVTMFGPRGYDPGLSPLLADARSAASRVALRYRDMDRMAAADSAAGVPGGIEPVSILAARIRQQDDWPVYLEGRSDPVPVREFDGNHRVFAARLFGFASFPCRLSWTASAPAQVPAPVRVR